MRNMIKLAAAVALVSPLMAIPETADARARYERVYGKDGRIYCRKSDGTVGAIVGAVGGGLLGNTIAGRGDKTLGTVIGAGGGALAGRAIERRRKVRC